MSAANRQREIIKKRICELDARCVEIEFETLESEKLRSESSAQMDAIALRGLDIATSSPFSEIQVMNVEAVDAYLHQLSRQYDHFAAKESRLDMNVLHQVSALRSVAREMEADVATKQQLMQSAHQEAMQTAVRRYLKVSHALTHINNSIGSYYEKLIDCGECYLSYPSDSTSLFAEGVMIIARSGDRPWVEVHKLSGGQQAACGFAV